MITVEERFWAKVVVTPSCWLWTASTDRGGYGRFKLDYKTKSAHRVSYEMIVGPIPEGLHIDHLCRVRECVNPSHMEPVTHGENTRRGISHNGGKTHCKQGHEFNKENTHNTKYGNARHCRVCDKEGKRRSREE